MEDSPSKPSVAELAGRFKGHILPMPNSNDELSFRRRPPPCSLKLQNQADDNEESDKSITSQKPFKIKMKNSAIIEKLQANLALSPTALLPSPRSPEVKLQPAPLSPTTPCSPLSPLSPTLRPSHLSSEEEDRISFDSPPEGTPLPSINKTRARLSFKRRLPTRQHRRSAGEEAGAFGSGLSPTELHSPKENGDEEQVFSSPTEEEAEPGQVGALKEAENKEEDCENTEAEVEKSDPEDRRDPEKEVEREKTMEGSDEEGQLPEQTDGDAKTEEEMPQQGGDDRE
ncbi:capZ-interacting protein isoform X2 [Acanthochromis polyacanthus]|uniref:capZ-interacting protein isoform X2 n=1 Tax=Acanthochromis polyacanthus TaxID=80966 RepID=UPI000B8EF3AC|nr:capZ-interacting protein isoform X2 [Acanthochromis polyacanthus]